MNLSLCERIKAHLDQSLGEPSAIRESRALFAEAVAALAQQAQEAEIDANIDAARTEFYERRMAQQAQQCEQCGGTGIHRGLDNVLPCYRCAQLAQPLTGEMIEEEVKRRSFGFMTVDPFSFGVGALWARDRMAQQAQPGAWNVTINGKWRAAFEHEQHAIMWARQFNLQEVVIAKETPQQAQPDMPTCKRSYCSWSPPEGNEWCYMHSAKLPYGATICETQATRI